MKNTIKKVIVMVFLMVCPLLISSVLSQTEPPLPGENGGSPVGSGMGGPVGGSAPIDGGLSILLAMSAMYGLKKVYKIRKLK